ncbi:hypothetical protein [Buttiauxella sp. S19-1]|uniref:hypothetical protein n=1 Tax=Buttiauxella sp. S19-1 TaxID=941430 RepID=UPI001EDA7E83|nr:hypothetical protein [Buttiauxella sp. S19-1]
MKKVIIVLTGVTLACLLSACTSDQLKSEQKTEREAMSAKQSADRQFEHAEVALAASTATTAAAAANLAAKKQQQSQADAALEQIVCPQPAE